MDNQKVLERPLLPGGTAHIDVKKDGRNMGGDFDKKVVFITGGATGIGKAMALEFASRGATVYVCSRSQNKLDALTQYAAEKALAITCVQMDVRDSSALKKFADETAQKHGSLDVWINNAAVVIDKPVLDFTDEEWDTVVDINLKAVYEGCRIAGKKMIELKKGGVIINASSYAALIPHAQGVLYAMTKAGVSSLTKSMAANFAPYGIRVFGFIPGMIRTDMSTNSISNYSDEYVKNIAMGRLGVPEDLSKLIVHLASSDGAYYTGTDIEITGGKYCVQNCNVPWQWSKE